MSGTDNRDWMDNSYSYCQEQMDTLLPIMVKQSDIILSITDKQLTQISEEIRL